MTAMHSVLNNTALAVRDDYDTLVEMLSKTAAHVSELPADDISETLKSVLLMDAIDGDCKKAEMLIASLLFCFETLKPWLDAKIDIGCAHSPLTSCGCMPNEVSRRSLVFDVAIAESNTAASAAGVQQ